MHQHIIEGTWSEVAKQMAALEGDAHVRLEIVEAKPGKMMKKGMFPQLKALTEKDFKTAEWRGSSESL
jgi:hypothetical protein